MPVIKNMINDMIKRYGYKKGVSIYMGMEHDNKKPFQKAMHTAVVENHVFKHTPKQKKGK